MGVFSNAQYRRINDYYDLAKMFPSNPRLDIWLRESHYRIIEMIENGGYYRIPRVKKNKLDPPLIVIRTRNFKNKAIIHNTKTEVIEPLIRELIKLNCNVINIGSLQLSQTIVSNNYREIMQNISINEEFELCANADCVLMTVEAGLFVGFAATDLKIIQYDNEVFDISFGMKKSFFKARRSVGLVDLDIRSYVKNERWNEAASAINEFARLNHDKIEKAPKNNQKKIDLGVI